MVHLHGNICPFDAKKKIPHDRGVFVFDFVLISSDVRLFVRYMRFRCNPPEQQACLPSDDSEIHCNLFETRRYVFAVYKNVHIFSALRNKRMPQ